MAKMAKNGWIGYLVNGWSYEVGFNFIAFGKPTFLFVFHILHNCQMRGNADKTYILIKNDRIDYILVGT